MTLIMSFSEIFFTSCSGKHNNNVLWWSSTKVSWMHKSAEFSVCVCVCFTCLDPNGSDALWSGRVMFATVDLLCERKTQHLFDIKMFSGFPAGSTRRRSRVSSRLRSSCRLTKSIQWDTYSLRLCPCVGVFLCLRCMTSPLSSRLLTFPRRP